MPTVKRLTFSAGQDRVEARHRGLVAIAPRLRYKRAWDIQNTLHELRKQDRIPDVLMLTEHPPVYTLGKNARAEHLLIPEAEAARRGIDVHWIDRGGDITFHGPGQLVGYPIFDLHHFYRDVGRYLREIEEALIVALSHFGIAAGREAGLTGVWTEAGKIAAIGIKLSRWFTKHGFALNVNTDLAYFRHIVPCGINNRPVTSMAEILGRPLRIAEVIDAVEDGFAQVFSFDFARTDLQDLLKTGSVPTVTGNGDDG